MQLCILFDTDYCNNGYGYSSVVGGRRTDEALYFPSAPLHVLANVTIRF